MKSILFLILATTALYTASSFAQGGGAGMGGGGGDGQPMDLISILAAHPEMNQCDGVRELIRTGSQDVNLPFVKNVAVLCNIKLPQDPHPLHS